MDNMPVNEDATTTLSTTETDLLPTRKPKYRGKRLTKGGRPATKPESQGKDTTIVSIRIQKKLLAAINALADKAGLDRNSWMKRKLIAGTLEYDKVTWELLLDAEGNPVKRSQDASAGGGTEVPLG